MTQTDAQPASLPFLCGLQQAAVTAGLHLKVSETLPEDSLQGRPLSAEDHACMEEHGEYDDPYGPYVPNRHWLFSLRHPDGRLRHGVISLQREGQASLGIKVGFHGLNVGGWVVPANDEVETHVRDLFLDGRCTDADVRPFVRLEQAVQPATLNGLFGPGRPAGLVDWSFYHPGREELCSDPEALSAKRAELETRWAAEWAASASTRALKEEEHQFLLKHGFQRIC